MALGTSNRDGGRTSEAGHLRSILKSIKGQVLSGLNVTQRGAGANMSVDVQIGDAVIPRSDGTYGHPAWADAITNVVITTADPSNPRRDILVMYIDYSVTPSTGVSNNTNGVVKLAIVAGTPAGSPSDPSNAAIQSAVGASNPFIKLARIRVGAGASSITNSVIDDLRVMAQGLLQGGWTYDDLYTWTYVSATSFAIAGVDVRSQFPVGTKIRVYQGGTVKYFMVRSTTFSTNTTITLDSSGKYSLTNVPIDMPAFSYQQNPTGYDIYATPLAVMRISASANTSLSTSAVTPNMANTDLSVGAGLTRSGSTIVIGDGISLVRVSAVIIADSMSNDTYMFSRCRRNRSGAYSEFTSQLQRMTSGFVSNSHGGYILSVQSGDIIDLRVDIGAGSGVLSTGRPQWLQVEVLG